MIPPFTENGVLPPGVHPATWDEFAERFLVFRQSDRRIQLGRKIRALYDESCRSGITRRFFVVGSCVTDKAEPQDFDCLLVHDPSIIGTVLRPFQYNLISRRAARRMFGGDVLTAIDDSKALKEYLEFFQTTRDGERMGILEIQR